MKKIIILMTSIFMVLINVSFTWASSDVETYRYDENINMNGVVSSTEKFFRIYDNWKVEDAKFNFIFTKSELLNVDYSTVTVEVNGTNIYSKRLDGKKKYKEKVEVKIPKDLLKDGENSLVVKAYKTISDKICQDDANTANWLVLHKESNINLKYSYENTENIISNFSSLFTQVDDGGVVDTVIALPNNATNDEINSAMNISMYLGKKLRTEDFKLDVKFESELKDTDKNVIYISNAKDASNKSAVIKISDSPYTDKPKKVLSILYDDVKALESATKLITSDTLTKTMNNQIAVVKENMDVDDLYEEKDYSKISFEDVGYGNTLLKGPFTQEMTYEMAIPRSKVTKLGTSFNLNFRYSKNLDFERSLVTVYLNEVPIGSKKLSMEKADDDSLKLDLPNDVLNKSYYQVKVVFNLKVKDLECVTRELDNPWAYVLNTSKFNFEYEDNNINLNTYPYPFVKDDLLNNVDLVIGKNITSKRLSNIANMVAYIGRSVKYNNNQINVISEDEFLNRKEDKNTIIVGTPSNNNAIKKINDSLYVKYNDNFSNFESNEKIKFFENASNEKGLSTIQIINSPKKKENSYLVVSGILENEVDVASKYLSDIKKRDLVNGDASIISKNEVVENIEFKDYDKKDEVESNKKSINFGQDTKVFALVVVVMLFGLVGSTLALSKKYKKEK